MSNRGALAEDEVRVLPPVLIAAVQTPSYAIAELPVVLPHALLDALLHSEAKAGVTVLHPQTVNRFKVWTGKLLYVFNSFANQQ